MTTTARPAGGGSVRAQWTTAYMDSLPDSSFLYVEPGGSKDSDGKTVPRSLRHFPVKDANGNVDLPHLRNALSRIPQSSLSQELKDRLTAKAQAMLDASGRSDGRPTEFRAQPAAYELRDDGEAAMPTLVGTLAVFDEWAEINSRSEGHFLERISPSAFNKTIRENRDRMRVLFNHGQDPAIGSKPLGPIQDLQVTKRGVEYTVPLLDTSYNRDLVEMLRAEPPVLGSSFRFQVMKEGMVRRPKKTSYNPRGLDERTVQEVRMSEFGPVVFPAYSGTSTGLRSITDEFAPELFPAELRSDPEDIDCLGQMLALGAQFVSEQDEDSDADAIASMNDILTSLTKLLPGELAENEPGEDEENQAPTGHLVGRQSAANLFWFAEAPVHLRSK